MTLPIPPADVLQKIIAQGDAETLVEWAEKIGKALRGKVPMHLVRRIFGTLKRVDLQQGAKHTFDDAAKRQLALLRPQLAYAVKRQSSATGFAQVLDPALRLVQSAQQLGYLIDFVEAILAYHREF